MSDRPPLSRNPFIQSPGDTELLNVEGSSSNSGSNGTEIPRQPTKRDRNRPQSISKPSPDTSQDFNSMLLLDDAAEHLDFNAIKEGLKFALGSNTHDSHWLPDIDNDTNDLLGDRHKHTDTKTGDTYTNTSMHLSPNPNAHSGQHSPNSLRIRTDFPSPVPSRNFLDPNRIPASPMSNKTFFTSSSRDLGSQDDFANSSHDLELGLTPSINVREVPDSPAKISNLITRVSDRIAGTGPAVLPARRSPSLREDENSVRSTLTPLTRSGSPLTRSGSPSILLGDNEEIVSRKSTGIDVYTLAPSAVEDMDSIEEFQEQQVRFEHAPAIPLKNVRYENVPIAETAPKSISDVKGLWKTDVPSMYLFGNSLKVFSPQNKFRQLCHRVLSMKITNTVFLVLLVLQTALLSYRQWNPAKLQGYMVNGYNWADYILMIINVIYTFEIVAKIIAYGFYDDRVMFEELNLPYPKNEIRAKLFQGTWVSAVKEYFHVLLQKRKTSKHKFYNTQKYNISSDSNDIELQDNPQADIRTKYNMDNLHHNITMDLTMNDSDLIDSRPMLSKQKLETKNTFFLPTRPADINVLNLRRAYIRNSWHRVNFVSVICFWISLFLSINHYDAKNNITIFRALSCLIILRLCNLTTGTSMILRALKLAVPQLIDVSLFIACFGIFFSILGVQSFKSSFRRHCVWYNPDDSSDVWVNVDSYCGSYTGTSGTTKPYILSDGSHSSTIKGFKCPLNSRCESLNNPYEGTVSFDNIFNSMELVFVVLSANTFTDLMYMAMDSEGLVASLFFVFCLFIMTVWLLNVFIAIVVTSFNLTRVGHSESEEHQIEGVFGPVSQPLSMHKELLDELKRKNSKLAVYYKFEFVFCICIIFDLVAQCFRKYDMSRESEHMLYRIESAFTALFFGEAVVRFFLYFPHWRDFFKLKRNLFDSFLAAITAIIIISPIKIKLGHAYYWLTVFQIMRCYRVVVISRFTRNLWLKIIGNLRQLIDLTIFLFWITFLTAIIYARFFEGSITPQDIEDGEVNFNLQTLPNAFISLYVITSTENWTSILYPMQGYQENLSMRVFAAILLIGWFFLSNFVILNVFIAVIANTLIVPEAEKKRKQLMQFIENITASIQNAENESGALYKFKNKFFKRKDTKEQLQMAVVSLLLSGTAVHDFLDTTNEEGEADDEQVLDLPKNKLKRFFMINFKRAHAYFNNPFREQKPNISKLAGFDPTDYAENILRDRNKLINKQNEFLRENPSYNKVFYVMAPRHKIRRFCQRIVTSSHGERIDGVEPYKHVSDIFTILMFLATLALVITACYLTPLFRANIVREYGAYGWTFWLDVGFMAVFTVEFLIRVLADGLVFTPNAYSRSPWNLIDFIVLISLWIECIAYLEADGDLSRFIRGFKALRVLRILTISETAKNNFHNTMISGIGKIFSAALMSLCLLIPFSIWGLNIFNGRLGVCADGSSNKAGCKNEYNANVFNWDIVSPNVWTQPLLNFNDFSKSFSSLFEITSLEGWVDLLYNLMSSTGVGTPAESFYAPFNGFFIVLYNFVGIVFILTLFISVIIHNYSLTTGRAYMTVDQRSWYQVKQFLLQVKPSKRRNDNLLAPFRRFCYRMTIGKDKTWNSLLNFVLFLHVVALMLEIFPLYNGLDDGRLIVYMIASALFTVNALMWLVAQGFKTHFSYKWLIFVFVVSVGSFVTTVIGTQVSRQSAFININKLFLVGTLFFVIPRSDRLSQFLKFASASLPDLFSLLFTWLVLFLLFAIALNQVFGATRIGPNGSDNLNVRTVPKALILLFRCSFGEGWNYIMDDFKVESPFCFTDSETTNTDCGNKQYAYILFIAWNIISMYIFLNMFVSLILDSFSYIMNKGDYAKLIERGEIRKYKRAWQKYDPEGSGFMPPSSLPKFLHDLEGAFSFHFYHGSLEIPVLCSKWFKRNNSYNPYDITVNYNEIEKSFESWDIQKIRERRKAYELFIEEAIMNMQLNNEPGISFKRVLLQLPLYKTFDTGTCLNLVDFLERRLLLQKVKKRLNQNKVYETITAYIIRWQYVKNKKLGIADGSDAIEMDQNLRRRSYLSGDRSPVQQQYFDDKFERDFGELSSPKERTSRRSSIMDEERSGVYIPKSPLNMNTLQFSTKLNDPPKVLLEVPGLSSINRLPAPIFRIGDAHLSGSTTLLEQTDSPQGSTDNVTDLVDVGENLRNSGWFETLKDIEKKQEN